MPLYPIFTSNLPPPARGRCAPRRAWCRPTPRRLARLLPRRRCRRTSRRAAPGAGPYLVVGGDGDAEHVIGIVTGLAVDQHAQIMARAGAEAGVETDGQVIGVGGAEAVVVRPAAPAAPVEHGDAALGAKPHPLLLIDRHAVYPLVDQLLQIGGEVPGAVEAVGAGPGAYPHGAARLLGERINPVIGEAVHGEIGLPLALVVTRHAAAVGAEPLVALAVDGNGEYVLVGKPFLAGEGLLGVAAYEVDFVHAHRGADPEAVGRAVYRQRAHEHVIAHTERFQHLVLRRDHCRLARGR